MERWRSSAALAAAVFLGATAPASALPTDTIVTNGSFETPNIATGTFAIFGNLSPWFHAPRPGTTSAGIELQDRVAGAPATDAGDQFIELDSDGPSLVYQDVATAPGFNYRLRFLYSARPNTASSQNHFSVAAAAAGATIGPLAGAAQTNWVASTLDFVASDATTRVEFLDLGPEESGGGLGAYLDEVSVVPVYNLCLLYDPSKAHKAGSTVPIKLRLCDANGVNYSSPSVALHATGVRKVDASASSVVEDSGQANPDDDFRYDADLAGYIFNLSTKGLTAGTWELTFTAGGGSTTYSAVFDVR